MLLVHVIYGLPIFDLDAPRIETEDMQAALDARSGDEALLPDHARARFTIRIPADAPLAIGEPLTGSLYPGRLYFFDPKTGATIHSRPSA